MRNTPFLNNHCPTALLPVAIMAHNEEKLIARSIHSALSQTPPPGYLVKVFIVANACTDSTETIVTSIAKKHPGRVELLSTTHKGKTKAIKLAIKSFQEMPNNEVRIPYVVFLDADCVFLDNNCLVKFVTKLHNKPLVCAISAASVPDVCFNMRTDLVAETYRAVYSLGTNLKINSITGMCYAIRLNILKIIDFPDFQFNEDMFIASRLDGRFYRDFDISIMFESPKNYRSEINRRTRQEIYSQQYQKHYRYLTKNGIRVKFFEESLGEQYRWGVVQYKTILKAWLHLPTLRLKFYSVMYLVTRFIARIRAYKKIRCLRRNGEIDFWSIER